MSDLPSTHDWAAWATRYREDLLGSTLPFWLPRALDQEHGGFLLCRDRDGALVDDDKGIWQHGRFTWLLGKLHATVDPRPEWLEACRHGIQFLEQHGFDPEDGRMWFHVARDGTPIRKRRYAFSEAFASIAFAAYARCSGDAAAGERAVELLQRFVDHRPAPKFTDARPSVGLAGPMIGIVTAQELRALIGWGGADEWIDRFAAQIRDTFWKPELGALLEQVAPDGTVIDHFDGRTLNPGHAIEAAWFLLREGHERGCGDHAELGVAILDAMWERGWDREHGGLLYFVDLHGRPVQEYWHDMKFWWPHNEAVIACLYAYEATGEVRFAARHAELASWCERHFADREFGEWFGYLHRDGTPSSTLKGNLWKGPFHMPRMQLVASEVCARLAESGV